MELYGAIEEVSKLTMLTKVKFLDLIFQNESFSYVR